MKKKLITFILFAILAFFEVIAQSPTLTWAKSMGGVNYDDYGNSVALDGA